MQLSKLIKECEYLYLNLEFNKRTVENIIEIIDNDLYELEKVEEKNESIKLIEKYLFSLDAIQLHLKTSMELLEDLGINYKNINIHSQKIEDYIVNFPTEIKDNIVYFNREEKK